MKLLTWLPAIGGLLAVVAPGYATLTSQLATPQSSVFCTGWASAKESCTEVTSIGEHGKISDRWGQITVYASAPEVPSSARTPKITVWVKDSFNQIQIRAGVYKMTGLYNVIIPENSFGQLVTPTSAATLATFNLTINNSNRYQYCVLGKCTIPLTLTSAQAQAVSDWENSGLDSAGTISWTTHPVEVDTVVNAWFVNSSNISTRHTSFHYVLNAPAVGGGGACEIEPASPGMPLIMLSVLFACFVLATRRRAVKVGLLWCCLSTTVAHASNIIAIGDADGATLQASAANNTLGATIDAMLTQHAITSAMTEGQTVMVGTPQADGSCLMPTLTLAASNDTAGVEEVAASPWQLVVEPDCEVWMSYAPVDSEETANDGELTSPIVYLQGGGEGVSADDETPWCARPFTLDVGTYDSATISLYGAPWLFGGATPSWWQSSLRSPATRLSVSGSIIDYGDEGGLDFPEPFGHTVSEFSSYGWTAEPGPPGMPPLVPWMHSADPSVYYVEAIQYWSLHSTSWSELMFPQPSGFWHMAHLGAWVRPAGRMDMIAAFSGILPNWSADYFNSKPPRLPAAFRVLGSWTFDISGPICPWARPFPITESCGQNCFVYTNYPGD